MVIFSCIFFKIEVLSICPSYCSLIDRERLIIKIVFRIFQLQAKVGTVFYSLVVKISRDVYPDENVFTRHFRQTELQSDPILRDEKLANKFKFSVGDGFVQKN